jgi:L-amino acid N-acyltransferase
MMDIKMEQPTKSRESVHTQLAREADLPAINGIYNKALLESAWIHDLIPNTMGQRLEWYRHKGATGLPVFVAELDGRVIGFSALSPFLDWPAHEPTVQTSIYVDEDYRGVGIGKTLVKLLIEHAKGSQKHSILAGINPGNAGSIQLHQSLGFEEVAHFKQVLYKFDQWQDFKFFQLLLP